MAGKIFIPSTENPLTPPPSGHYLFWIDDQGFFKKMDSDGNITNLSAQSLNDLNDTVLTTLEDGQILVYDENSDKWINQDFPDIDFEIANGSITTEKIADEAVTNSKIEPVTRGLENFTTCKVNLSNGEMYFVIEKDTKLLKAYNSDDDTPLKMSFSGDYSNLTGGMREPLVFFSKLDDRDIDGINVYDDGKWKTDIMEVWAEFDPSVLSSNFEIEIDQADEIQMTGEVLYGEDLEWSQLWSGDIQIGGGSGAYKTDDDGNVFQYNYETNKNECHIKENHGLSGGIEPSRLSEATLLLINSSGGGGGGGGDGSASSLVNGDGKTVAQPTSTGVDLIASNDVTMLKTDVGGVEVYEHLRVKASQYGNAVEIGEGNTKYFYLKFDQLKNLNFLANYNKGFIFRVDDSIDGVLTDAFSPFSIFKDNVVSNSHHNFMDSISVKGQIHSDTDGMSEASLLSTTPVNGVDVELHKIIPALNQVRYATRNNAQHIFSIDNADGNDMHDITVMGLNGTVHTTKHQFNAGVSMFGNKLESLADPTSNDDAATKGYVDTEIASVGQPETLYDNIGEERVTATIDGVDLYGTTTFRKPESGYFLQHIPDSGADAGKRLFAMIDYGGPTKFQSRWGRGFQFQVADSSDANLTQLFNISYDMIESKKLHKFAGSVEGNSAKFSYIEVENFLGGTFLKLGDGTVDNFVFSTRSNQNKIIQPSDYICYFMFDDNGHSTVSLTIAKGLCIADTDFQFNSYTSFKQEMDLSNKRIKNVGTPTQPSDAVTKAYVDSASFTLDRIGLGDNTWASVTVSETLLELLQKFDTLLAAGGIADESITFDKLSTTAYSEDLTVSSDCEELATAKAVKNYVDATMADESTRREFLSTSFTANTPLSFNHGLQKKLVLAQVFDSDGNSVEFHQKCVDNENVHLTIGVDGVFDVLVLG